MPGAFKRRPRPKALTLLNSRQTVRWAQAFAERILHQAGPDLTKQVETAHHLAYSRDPDPWETDTALTFFERQREIIGEQLIEEATDESSEAVPPPLLESLPRASSVSTPPSWQTIV